MTELAIIKLLLKKDNYNKYIKDISKLNIDTNIYKLINSISKYYNNYKEHEYIAVDELEAYYLLLYPTEKGNSTTQTIFQRLRQLEVSDSVAADMVKGYIEQLAAAEVVNMLLPVMQGHEHGKLETAKGIIEHYTSSIGAVEQTEPDYLVSDLYDLVSDSDSASGLQWRLSCLRRNLGGLNGGTLGHIFARPESGKTSFVASELTHFIHQLGADEYILWVGNEERGSKVKYRFYQALLGFSHDEFLQTMAHGKFEEVRQQAIDKGIEKVKFIYDTNITFEDIQRLIDYKVPRVLCVDIADHVGFRGSTELTNGAARLEELYRRYRALAGTYNLDCITVAQAAAEVAGRKALHLEHMNNSKTGKPGALDYAIGIGATYDASESDLRWVTIAKNKIGQTIDETSTVKFDKARARYSDL